ncbi:hypothetical protein HF086_000985 [Spodoptera exigua]|uniref:Uncharacterized protein n=1 Tax=Spodoptera exigua TaxID=7107 RepID=A0A922M6L5_SPOEX|nr:hypothetical protein HF086_000985 [Spodoptera exigua]
MIRTVALLCLLAPAFIDVSDAFEVGFRRRFGLNPFDSVFINSPRTNTSAEDQDWVNVERPYSAEGYEALQMWCPVDDYVFCILTDETGNTAGTQVSVHAAARSAYTDPDKALIRNDYVTVEGFKDQMVKVAKYESDLDSVFTKQACILWMELECSSNSIFTWFPLYIDGELNGMGFMVLGTVTFPKGVKDNYEHPTKGDVQKIVTSGPECLYEDVEKNGVTTMHIYFTEHPRRIFSVEHSVGPGWAT